MIMILITRLETLQSSPSERTRYMLKTAAIHYLNVYRGAKSRSRSAKKRRLQRLPHICYSVKYERSSSSDWRTGTGKPKSRSRRFDFLGRSKSPILSTRKTISSCMTVHDNVRVAVIVSKIWTFQSVFFKCVSLERK